MGEQDREQFGARTKAEAMRTAHGIVAKLLQSYFEVGQPHTDASDLGVPEADGDRLQGALVVLQGQHRRLHCGYTVVVEALEQVRLQLLAEEQSHPLVRANMRRVERALAVLGKEGR